MNHKRRRPKNNRAGCLLCKPHKANGISSKKAAKPGDRRRWLGWNVESVYGLR